MKPSALGATILGDFAIAATASFVVSPSSSISMSRLASTSEQPTSEAPVSAKTSAAVVVENWPSTGAPRAPAK
jgi:hypothetical protein